MGLNCALCGRVLNEESSQRTVYGDVGRECARKLDVNGVLLRSEFEKMSPKIQDQLAQTVKDIRKKLSDHKIGSTITSDIKYLKDTKGDYKSRMMNDPGMGFYPKRYDFKELAKRDPSTYRYDLIMQDIDSSALLAGKDALPEWATLFTKYPQYRDILADLYPQAGEIFEETGDELEFARKLVVMGIDDDDVALALVHLIIADRAGGIPLQGMTIEEMEEMAKNIKHEDTKELFKEMISIRAEGSFNADIVNQNGFSNARFLNAELSTREWNQLKPEDSTEKSLHSLHRAGKISAEDYSAIQKAMADADEKFLREKGTVIMANNHEYNIFGDGIDPTSPTVPKNWSQAIVDNNIPVRNFKRAASDCVASIKDIELSIQNKKALGLHSSSLMFLSPCWKELEQKGYMGAIMQLKDGNVTELALVKKPVPNFTSVYAPSTAQEVFNAWLKKYPVMKSNPFGNNKNHEYLILAPGPVSESKNHNTHESPSVDEKEFIQLDGLHLFALHAAPRMSPERKEEGTHLTQVAYTVQAPTSDLYEISPMRWHSAIKPMFGGSGARFAPTLKIAESKEELSKVFENPRVLKNINDSLNKADYLENKKTVTTYKEFMKNEMNVTSKSLGDKLHTYSLASAVLTDRDGRSLDASEITDAQELEKYLTGHFGTNSATTRLADAITRAQTNSDSDPSFKNITSSIKRLPEVFSASYYMKEGTGLRGYKAEDMWAGHEARHKFIHYLTKPILSRWVKDGKEKEALDIIKVNSEARRSTRSRKHTKKSK